MSLIGTLDQAIQVRDTIVGSPAGKIILNQLYPNDFEYYMCGFELLNSDFSTEKYFIFPILPNSMSYNDSPLTKITKTAGGVSVVKTDQFIPKTININGTFGRSFKILVGKTTQDLFGSFENSAGQITPGSVVKGFSEKIKTGYGCCKVLEELLTLSNQKDSLGKPRFLIFYNLAFNQQFFVEYEEQTWSMTLETNMVWNYSLRLKAVAPSQNFLKTKLDGAKSNVQLSVDDYIQKQSNSAFSSISTLLNKKLTRF
jgi:hypothetical protein